MNHLLCRTAILFGALSFSSLAQTAPSAVDAKLAVVEAATNLRNRQATTRGC